MILHIFFFDDFFFEMWIRKMTKKEANCEKCFEQFKEVKGLNTWNESKKQQQKINLILPLMFVHC